LRACSVFGARGGGLRGNVSGGSLCSAQPFKPLRADLDLNLRMFEFYLVDGEEVACQRDAAPREKRFSLDAIKDRPLGRSCGYGT